MAGALSAHLINAYQSTPSGPRQPFASTSTPIVTSGAMSFNPPLHGTPFGQNSFQFDSSSFMDISQDTAVKIATLQAKLNQKLGPEFISQRPGPGGGPKLTYAEGWKVINLANEVFGFNGWSSSVVSLTTDFVDYSEESRRYNVGVTAIMKVTLRDGVYHEDIGYGMLENSKSKAAAIDKCKKEAVTDGLKRALRNFGNLLGNCLYDKSYTQEIVKMKVPQPKFEKSELYRRPEFGERPATTAPIINPSSSTSHPQPHIDTPTRPPANQPNRVPLPAHVRAEMVAAMLANTNQQPQGGAASSSAKGKALAEPLGLQTPLTPQVPVQRQGTSIPSDKETAPPPVPEVPPPAPPNNPQAQVPSAPPEPEPEPDMMEVVEDAAESESYLFSEDDAFLATVDLGDLGRPIDFEEGHDRQEESLDDTSPSLLAAREAHYAEEDEGNAAAAESLGQPPPQPQERGPSKPALGGASSHLQQADASLPKIFPHQRRYLPQRVGEQGNIATADPPPTENALLPKVVPRSPQRPRVTGSAFKPPSMGGFHFPPGVQNPLYQFKPPTSATPGSTIGVKRPADALSSNPGAPLRKSAGLGMGLQQAPQGQGSDGDLKRLKR